jgi:type IV pilus assembly protein PilV
MTLLQTPAPYPVPNRQHGFSLLEVLIALVILSIGLLGLAGLQTFSVKFVHQSYQRTQATLLIYDIVDRMRANGGGVAAGNYALALPLGSPAPASPDCETVACTAANMAAYDMSQWYTNVTQRSGLARSNATITTVAPPLYTITVSWREHDLTFTQSITAHLP